MSSSSFVALPLLVSAAACSTSATSPGGRDQSPCPGVVGFVAVDDSSSSGVGPILLDGGGILAFGADLGTDPVLTVTDGRSFFISRHEGRIFTLDACGRATSAFLVNDPGHPGTSNPQGVAVAPDGALWVPRYNVPSIAIVRDGNLASAVDMSTLDSGGGNPYASGIRILQVAGVSKAFVPLEKLEWVNGRLSPTRPSTMLRVDVATQTIEAEVALAGRNPFNAPGALVERDGAIYLAEPGDFLRADELDAGIERFDSKTSTTHILVRELDLGASAVEVTISGPCGAVLLADPSSDNRVSLGMFDADTGAVLARNIIGPSADFDTGLRGLAWVESGRILLAGDRRRTDRGYPIHAFERDDACNLRPLADETFVSQQPVSVASAAN